jgi:Flp pilus assembly protein TadD
LGLVLSRFVEVETARKAFEKALELEPNLTEARVNLALLQAQAGEFGPAGENLDRAIQLQGNTARSLLPLSAGKDMDCAEGDGGGGIGARDRGTLRIRSHETQ